MGDGTRADGKTDPDAAVREWSALLERFERDLESDAEPVPWAPAVTPLPLALAERARRVRDAQRARIASLARERDDALAQLTALRRVPAAPADRPAYLDRHG